MRDRWTTKTTKITKAGFGFLVILVVQTTFFLTERDPSSVTGREGAARATFSRKRAKGCEFYRVPCHALVTGGYARF